MKKIPLFFAIFLFIFQANAWGPIGHRIVGQIAENHLSKTARKQLKAVLGDETLAEISTYMDFIRSDSTYDHMAAWHYCTIPDGKTYEEAGTPAEGDAIIAINRLVDELKTKRFTDKDERFALACLVHLIGDLHQPLHVGNGTDKGGNDLKVEYFWKPSNLHRVWDSGIIDGQQLSYTEYASWLDRISEKDEKAWQMSTVLDWAYESKNHRNQVYDLPENKKMAYEYDFKNLDLVNLRLKQAGIRLAGILNAIYG